MQIGFPAVFGICLIIVLLFGPNPKRMFFLNIFVVSCLCVAGAKKVASSLSLSGQEYV